MSAPFRIEPLGNHDRSGFSCGVEALDRYFRQQVTQDIRRRVSNCFVAVGADNAVAGYYTFAAAGLPLTQLPPDLTKRLPRYPLLPAALIGRLAVRFDHRGIGLGGAMIADAGERALRAEPAVFAILVEAKDETAEAFYRHLGFQPFAERPSTLFLPAATFAKARPGF